MQQIVMTRDKVLDKLKTNKAQGPVVIHIVTSPSSMAYRKEKKVDLFSLQNTTVPFCIGAGLDDL